MRRSLTAATSALVLGAVGVLGAVPASADPASPEPLPSLDLPDKVGETLRAAEGTVTAFVRLDAPSALDVVESGGSTSEAGEAVEDVESLAEDVVPAEAGARARSAGPQRVSVTSTLVAGTIVTGDAAQVRELAESDDVVSVALVPLKEPRNKGVDLFTRAAEVWESYGETGEGVRIGIIDTGVDYTHADFGGPGTAEAYAAAYGEDGTAPAPEGTFDGAKLLGGYDFAGTLYDASGRLPGSTTVPQPDPNPIDGLYTRDHGGHGTHVAGSAAGYGVTAEGDTFRGDYGDLEDISDWKVGPGAAPEAGIYALKVFGDYGGSTGVTINALEWAADPDGDLDFSDRLDIVNLSLGGDAAPVDDPENLFVDRLSDLGTLSVMAAGNAGDVTDIGGSPGNASTALSVANSVSDTMTYDAVEVVGAADESLLGRHAAQNTVSYAGSEDAEGPVVHLGEGVDGCEPLTEYAEQIAGAIVWLDWDDNDNTRACGSGARWANATAAGAAGVLIGTENAIFTAGIAGDAETPGAQLTAAATDLLLPEIQAGTLSVRLGPSYRDATFVTDESVADLLNPGSSRGAHGSLGVVKPDVAAPGTRISSAAAGAGTMAHTLSGTSMASPHVAGIAALVRAANPGWSPQEVKAGIMNTATNPVYSQPGPGGPVYGPERVGAGRVDAVAAVGTGVIAYDSSAPDGVSVAFGVVDVGAETVTVRRTVTVENLENRGPVVLRPTFEAATTTGGATITATPSSVTVPPGRSRTVTVTLTADPTTLARDIDPTQSADSGVGVPREYVAALSGQLVLEPPRPGTGPTLHVPVHAAPRLVSDLAAQPVEFASADALTAPLALTGRHVNSGGWTSLTSVLELVATSPRLEDADADLTSPSQVAAGDIRYVGAMSTAPRLVEAGYDPALGYLGIGIAVQGEWPTLGTTTVPVIDTDVTGDGIPDIQTAVQKLDPTLDVTIAYTYDYWTGQPYSQSAVNGAWGDTDTTVYDNNVLVAPIPLSLFRPGVVPTFSVWTFSQYAPNGLNIVDGVEPFTYDPFAPDLWTSGGVLNDVFDPSGTDVTVHRTPEAGADAGPLLVLHSHNADGARAQVVDVTVPEVVAVPTTTTLTVDGEPAVGSEVTLTATVEPAGASGTVSFRDGDAELATATVEDGTATAVVTLGAGTRTLSVAFTPDAPQWEASVSAPFTVEVGQAASTTSLRLARSLATYGTETTATVTVDVTGAAPSGTVELRRDGEVVATGELAVDGSRGTATVTLPRDLAAGGHRLTAVYAGSADVAGSTSRAATYVVLPALPRVDIDAESRVPRGSSPQVGVEVLGRGGAPVPTGSVTVTAGFRVIDRVQLDEEGGATVQLPPVRFLTILTATYGGDAGYLPGIDLATITPR
ncbi:S8 family serine peptidase [Oceanitalea stevensii]|uniref:S8 family serine peptidase n=1 Tax=Oceanitalea stevensii TaxID=2763072 RepID=A0ABR8Z2D1_9MICO|nr:S8 family serine peptidase [Oceanitalea stevensii]MBD8062086.1 S8 family serine peptidase [Oceanitalea stevensii]